MKWYVDGEQFTSAWEAADYITEGTDTSGIFSQLEQMHDNEESEVNGFTVTSYVCYEE